METKNLEDLKANPKNPRTMSKHDAEALAKSMTEFGDLSCIVFNVQTGQLVGGHQRIETLKKLPGDKKIVITDRYTEPDHEGTVAVGYVFLNNNKYAYREVDWPLQREMAANIAANRIQGEFDLDLLAEANYMLNEQAPDLLALTGQTTQEISSLLDAVGADGDSDPTEDEVPTVEPGPPVSKLGEIYQLGKHRLMCGDSTDLGQVSDLVNGQPVSMVFTDPPYNAAFNGRSGNHDVIENDDLSNADFKKFISAFMETLYMVAQDAPKYICTDWKMYPLIYDLMEKPAACIVWVKNMFGMGSGYRHQHELILFEGNLSANDQSDVWEIKRDNGADYDHPTQKPVALAEHAIRNSSIRLDIVLDLFSGSGSGSTLIACEKLDRINYAMELDPKYCDVIRKRYAQYTNQQDWQAATPAINEVSEQPAAEPVPLS